MYISKYFAPHELVPPDVYNLFQDKNMIYRLFDENALRVLDLIREWAGVSLTVNNWYWKGNRKDCGFRTANSPIGAKNSAHKLAKAFDIVSPKITTSQLWELINKNQDKLPCKIRIEKTSGGKPITWLHFDTNAASTQAVKVYYFNA